MSEGNGAMRFSYCMLPDYPLGDSIEMIQTADELGSLQTLAAAEAKSATGAGADALVYLADVVQVSRGGWFETDS